MTKHTPGPWEYWNERAVGCDTFNVQTTDHGELIAIVDTAWVLPRTGGGHDANARLIAAAPDLLAACEAAPILSKYHGPRGFELERFVREYETWCEQLRAATDKAKGDSA